MTVEAAERAALREKFVEYQQSRDVRVRDELVHAHLALAEHLARRFNHRGEPLDDLIQVACVGLLKAVERFDASRGLEFSTFAIPTIVGELKRHFRDKGWAVRVPRQVQELYLLVSSLTNELGRSPTIIEVAQRGKVTEDEVLEAMEAGRAYRSASLDAGSGDDEAPGISARLGSEDPGMADVEHRLTIGPLLDSLPERERFILRMRFFEGRTQSEIARELGISQMHVSRLIARSLRQLRGLVGADLDR
jgi:RNA polymerase sigma-B factor